MDAIGLANWKGTWKEGGGDLSTGSATISDAPYTYASRFEGAMGTSPEEFLAAAEAGCFNQALANNFGMNALTATSISTKVIVSIEQDEKSRPTITGMHLTTEVSAIGATDAVFQQCAERARTNCTIARLLKIDLTMSATLIT